MANPFTPKFVDLVKNSTTTTGTGDFLIGAALNGYTSFATALSVGDRFYYSCLGIDKPAEREVGRGTLLAGGKIAREPISGTKTAFTTGNKSIALIAASEWFDGMAANIASAASVAQGAATTANGAVAAANAAQAEVNSLSTDVGDLAIQVSSLDNELGATVQDVADLNTAVSALGNGGSSGGSISAANRTELASADPSSGAVRMLLEAGREGLFRWDPSNLQVLVSADLQQGIYVPPTGANGSTGAWVRAFDGAIEVTWFGLSTTASGTGNSVAMAAALATAKARALSGVGYASGGEELHTKAGDYDFNSTISVDFAANLTGDYVGGFSGGGTVFNFPDNAHGITVAAGGSVGTCRVIGLQLRGDSATPGSGYFGLNCRGKIIAERLYISGFEHGIDCYGNSGASLYSNVNGSSFKDIACQGNVWGTWSDGPDANNIMFSNVACITNALGGHMDSSFLGNIYEGGDLSTNGGPNSSSYKTRCHSGGHIYACMKGQEAWCSANGPTGAATSNQGWIYVGEGAASAAQPTWSAAQTWYFSAPYAMDPDNNNARTVFRDIYVEPDQNPAIMTWPGVTYVGSDTGSILTPGGAYYSGVIRVGYAGAIAMGDVGTTSLTTKQLGAQNTAGTYYPFFVDPATGDVHVGGTVNPGADTNQSLNLRSWGAAAYTTLNFCRNNTVSANLQFYQDGTLYYFASAGTGKHYFYSLGSPVFDITGTGINLANGKTIALNGTTLINGSGVVQAAAMPAHTGDVTSAAGSVALSIVNDAVTYAKMQNISGTDRLLGRSSAGAGDVEEIVCTAAGRALIDDADAAAQRATLGLATVASSGSASDLNAGTMVRPVATAGDLTTSGGKIGYATGAGGTVAQATSKATGVTLNKICGEITMNAAALAASTAVTFTLTNSAIAAGDRIIVNHASGGTFGAYLADARAAAGSATVMLRNVSASSLSEAVVLGFSVIKAVTA